MTTQTLIFRLTLVALIVAGTLVWLAVLGYTLAIIALAVLATVALIGIGAGVGLLYTQQAAQQQQKQFMDNADENLRIMQALQSVQNRQNDTLMKQLSQTARLPEPSPPNGDFEIVPGVFDELD